MFSIPQLGIGPVEQEALAFGSKREVLVLIGGRKAIGRDVESLKDHRLTDPMAALPDSKDRG